MWRLAFKLLLYINLGWFLPLALKMHFCKLKTAWMYPAEKKLLVGA